MICAVVLFVDGVGQHQSRAAGGIQLVVVVLLHDLHIIRGTQNGRRALAQLGQHIDADGHIGALEHGHRAGQLHDLELQLFGQTGGAYHDGQLVGLAVGQGLFHGSGGAEVDDHIALAVQLFQAVVNGDAVLLAVLHIDAGNDTAVLPLGDHLAQHMSHPAADALNDNIRHLILPRSLIFRKGQMPGRTFHRAFVRCSVVISGGLLRQAPVRSSPCARRWAPPEAGGRHRRSSPARSWRT